MDKAAYDEDRLRERREAEERRIREALADEVAMLFLNGVKDFLERRAYIAIEPANDGSFMVTFRR